MPSGKTTTFCAAVFILTDCVEVRVLRSRLEALVKAEEKKGLIS